MRCICPLAWDSSQLWVRASHSSNIYESLFSGHIVCVLLLKNCFRRFVHNSDHVVIRYAVISVSNLSEIRCVYFPLVVYLSMYLLRFMSEPRVRMYKNLSEFIFVGVYFIFVWVYFLVKAFVILYIWLFW